MNCFLGIAQGYKGQGGKELLKLKSNAKIVINAYIDQKEDQNGQRNEDLDILLGVVGPKILPLPPQ